MATREEKFVLAVDLGTSGPKSAIVSTSGRVVADVFVANDLYLLEGGGAEQDPEQWWQSILASLKTLLSKNLVSPTDIVAVSCSSQWSGTVAVDEDGRHLMNALVWLDSRGSKYIDRIIGGPLKVKGYSLGTLLRWVWLTGGAPSKSGKDSLAHILYIKNELPDVYEQTHKFLEPKDYINLRLTGSFAASTDSIALHWVTDNRDIERVRYHDDLLHRTTLDPDKLPQLKQPGGLLGPLRADLADELGLPRTVKVATGAPDVQAAAVGSGAVEDYSAHLYIGTSSWLTCHVPFKRTHFSTGIISLPSAIPGRYFVANEQESAGACLSFLRDNIFFPQDRLHEMPAPLDFYEQVDQMAGEVSPGSGGLLFLSWLYGERTPIDDRVIRGGFLNLSLNTTRAQLVRSVLEGVALNSRWLLEAVERFTRKRLDPIRIIGGGALSDTWCQIHADVLNRSIARVASPLLANVRGAAFLAAAALGYNSFSDIGDNVPIERVFTPRSGNKRLYDLHFREFVGSYRRVRRTCLRLNRAFCDTF